MKASNSERSFIDDHQKIHQKQQERLRAMSSCSDKTPSMSADLMIENLLNTSFKQLSHTTSAKNQVEHLEIPTWLQSECAAIPPEYKYLWSLVQSSSIELADTQKVSQLLLTSGLQVDVLGFIWNLANKTIPGQLTKQEFYIVLALVGLAQAGYTFSNLSILKLINAPTIPFLQVGLQKNFTSQPYVSIPTDKTNAININFCNESVGTFAANFKTVEKNSSEIKINQNVEVGLNKSNILDNLQESKVNVMENDNKILQRTTNSKVDQNAAGISKNLGVDFNIPNIDSSLTTENDFSVFQSVPAEIPKSYHVTNQVADSVDEFTEFQSAQIKNLDPLETVVISQKRDIPKIPFPKTVNGKLISLNPNVIKISPETEKKLKIISPTESLASLPESKISSSNKVMTSISVLGSNQGIGSRLANHSFGTKEGNPKCHKFHKVSINNVPPIQSPAEEEIILGVKTRNFENVIPKCKPKSFKIKETKINNEENSEPSLLENLPSDSYSSTSYSVENTRKIEIPLLGTINETVLPSQLKNSMPNTDLISVYEDKYSALREIDLMLNSNESNDFKEVGDDFGDFHSASISNLENVEPVKALKSATEPSEVDEKSDWGDWSFNSEMHLNSMNTSHISAPEISNTPDQMKSFEKNEFSDSFLLLNLNDECENSLSKSFSKVDPISLVLTPENGNSSDGILFNEKTNDETEIHDSKLDKMFNPELDDFQDFLSSEKESQPQNNLKEDSLMNLQLKPPLLNKSEPELVWKKCIDSCLCLIQEGYDILHNINLKSVLDEVLAAPKTETYLNYLNIVYQVSKRVSQNLKDISLEQEKLEKLWGRLQDLCFEYNIKLKHNEDSSSEGLVLCNICFGRIGYNLINQGENSFHSTCANFWINCVDKNLPLTL